RVLLVYKSVTKRGDPLRFGVAGSDSIFGPYRRLRDEPIFDFAGGQHVEDPYVWHDGQRYQMVMKDMEGGIAGEPRAGVHAVSDDGVDWRLSDPPLAWSRRLRFDDGSTRTCDAMERPQLLIEAGRPTHLFCATCDLTRVGADGCYTGS